MQPRTKISILREHMENNDWNKAISLASKFPRLGSIRSDVLDAQLAVTNPRFLISIGKNPDELFKAGCDALRNTYAASSD